MKECVNIKIGNNIKSLRYSNRAISDIEDMLDKPFGKIDFKHLRFRELATIIWAGLAERDMTPDQIIDELDNGLETDYLVAKMWEAMNNAFGDKIKKSQAAKTGK